MNDIKYIDLGEMDCIHCKTEEEAKAICQIMHDAGLIWSNGKSYETHTSFNVFKERTCYVPNIGRFQSISYGIEENFTIHPAKDFIQTKVK